MSRLSEADVEKSCKPKDAATEGFCFQQTMIRVKVGIERVFADTHLCNHSDKTYEALLHNLCCINKPN